jgi:hypothetical protein
VHQAGAGQPPGDQVGGGAGGQERDPVPDLAVLRLAQQLLEHGRHRGVGRWPVVEHGEHSVHQVQPAPHHQLGEQRGGHTQAERRRGEQRFPLRGVVRGEEKVVAEGQLRR